MRLLTNAAQKRIYGLRLFSVLRTIMPEFVIKEISNNPSFLKPKHATEELEELTGLVVKKITQNNCQESAKFVKDLSRCMGDKEISGIYFQNNPLISPKKLNPEVLSTFSSLVSYIMGNIPHRDGVVKVEDPTVNNLKTILPHTDFITEDPEVNLISFIAFDCQDRNYRTFQIDNATLFKDISPRSLEILQKKLFYPQPAGAGEILKLVKNDFHLSFSTEQALDDEMNILSIPDIIGSGIEIDEVKDAVNELIDRAFEIYQKNELEGFYLADGECLILYNHHLHGRDQFGVKQDVADSNRVIAVVGYSRDPNQSVSRQSLAGRLLNNNQEIPSKN